MIAKDLTLAGRYLDIFQLQLLVLVSDISNKAGKLLHVSVRVKVLRPDTIVEGDDEHANHVLEAVD